MTFRKNVAKYIDLKKHGFHLQLLACAATFSVYFFHCYSIMLVNNYLIINTRQPNSITCIYVICCVITAAVWLQQQRI